MAKAPCGNWVSKTLSSQVQKSQWRPFFYGKDSKWRSKSAKLFHCKPRSLQDGCSSSERFLRCPKKLKNKTLLFLQYKVNINYIFWKCLSTILIGIITKHIKIKRPQDWSTDKMPNQAVHFKGFWWLLGLLNFYSSNLDPEVFLKAILLWQRLLVTIGSAKHFPLNPEVSMKAILLWQRLLEEIGLAIFPRKSRSLQEGHTSRQRLFLAIGSTKHFPLNPEVSMKAILIQQRLLEVNGWGILFSRKSESLQEGHSSRQRLFVVFGSAKSFLTNEEVFRKAFLHGKGSSWQLGRPIFFPASPEGSRKCFLQWKGSSWWLGWPSFSPASPEGFFHSKGSKWHLGRPNIFLASLEVSMKAFLHKAHDGGWISQTFSLKPGSLQADHSPLWASFIKADFLPMLAFLQKVPFMPMATFILAAPWMLSSKYYDHIFFSPCFDLNGKLNFHRFIFSFLLLLFPRKCFFTFVFQKN